MAMEPEVNAYAEPKEAASDTEENPDERSVPSLLREKIDACKRVKRDMAPEWTKNIDYRRGKPNMEDSDDTRNTQAIDYAYTKSKQTQLHSKTPQVIVEFEGSGPSPYKLVAPVFQRRLNKRIRDAKAAIAMDEVLPDLINASGFGAVMVSYDARTEIRDTPLYDETKLTMIQQAQKALGLFKNPKMKVPFVTDRRFKWMRVSPVDLIWDTASPTSDFDEHALIGRSARIPKAEARRRFENISDEDLKNASGDDRTDHERMVSGDEQRKDNDVVTIDEIFYYRYRYHPEEPSFKAIQHVVFLRGKKEPIINEPWKGQKMLPDGSYIGSCKVPIRVGTLTYISDEPIPPSDSAMIRPMVDELIEYRNDQRMQRKHSVPVRWADVNRLSPETMQALMEGEYQGIHFVNGDGSRAIGEVARASYPRENNMLEQSLRQDVQETFKIGPNQLGTSARGDQTATESDIVQSNFATTVGYERGRVTSMFLSAVEVTAGLVLLHDDFDIAADLSEQDKQRVQGVDLRTINHEAVFTIRPDSTVLLDAEQEYKRVSRFLDVSAKSGYANVKYLFERMAALSQLDPAEAVKDPEPNSPEQPNISYRFSGAADLVHPVVMSLLMKHGQAPTTEELKAAYTLLKAVELPPEIVETPSEPGAEIPDEIPDDPNPSWNMADRLNKRNAERGAQ